MELHDTIRDDKDQDSGHRQLLTIVARGTAIITEIYRLVELIPDPFQQNQYNLGQPQPAPSRGAAKQYSLDEIVFDFSYFKDAEEIEARIEQDPQLKRADEQFCDNYSDILTRFFLTFESTHRYASDLNRFIADLEGDIYIGQTFDTLLLDTVNRQLLCEAYFQLGYMLLLVDLNFDGDLRERLIVAYYRYSSYKSSPSTDLDGACNLMRSTQFKCEQQKCYRGAANQVHRRPANYPESYLARTQVDQTIVNTLIAKLQIVDIYNKTVAVFPHPDHRSHALSQQASMLYVLLYFCPSILKSQRSRMREITDKFFCDNWIIDVYMGERVNLIEAWDPYKAASESLAQILDVESVRSLSSQMGDKFASLHAQINEQYLLEGWLNEETFLEGNRKILNCIRDSNVVLRWILLHLSMRSGWQTFRPIKLLQTIVVASLPDKRQLCEFLQRLAVLEKRVDLLFDEVNSVKLKRVAESTTRARETLEELVAIFDDTRPMRWVKAGANLSLAKLLSGAREELATLDPASSKARDLIIRTIKRIESARDSYSDDRSLQVVQLFTDTRQSLLKALRNIDLEPKLKMILQSVGDFNYAWRLMDEFFTEHLRQTIKDNPFSMFGLEAIIIKLSSAFETQLLRIQQVGSSADLISVTQYHSAKLVCYIKQVLQVIPATILELIGAIISIQTNNILGSMPSKIPLDHLKDYALPDQRLKMLELTSKISNYAKGMMTMPNATIGLVRLNSRQLLEDGMRGELVKRMTDSIQSTLQFNELAVGGGVGGGSGGGTQRPHQSRGAAMQAAQNLKQKLEALSSIINGYKRSLEYIQDFLFIYGLRMWQEELARIIKTNFEQALACLLANANVGQLSDTASLSSRATVHSQTRATSSSRNSPLNHSNKQPGGGAGGLQSSFIVRLLGELLRASNPRETIYDEQTNAWYEQRGAHQQVLDARTFQLIHSSLGATGMNCLDKLCCTLTMLELQRLNLFILDSTTLTRHKQKGASASASNSSSTKTPGLLEALKFVDELRKRSLNHRNVAKAAASQHRQSLLRAFSSSLAKLAPFSERLLNHLLSIGQLQTIRMSISCVLTTSCRYEARHLYACLSTLNATLLATLRHGKQQQRQWPPADEHKSARQSARACNATSSSSPESPPESQSTMAADLCAGLDESQLVFELANHLEWVGLSDPMGKVYTFELEQQANASPRHSPDGGGGALHRCASCAQLASSSAAPVGLIYLLLLEQSSKFNFSRSLSGFLPRQARNFYDTAPSVDALPLFYGVLTLLHHFRPGLELATPSEVAAKESCPQCATTAPGPLDDLLGLMGVYVESLLGHPLDGASIRPQELTLEVANVILTMIELSRQARVELGASGTSGRAPGHLPEYLLDTFQFTVCHLNPAGG